MEAKKKISWLEEKKMIGRKEEWWLEERVMIVRKMIGRKNIGRKIIGRKENDWKKKWLVEKKNDEW